MIKSYVVNGLGIGCHNEVAHAYEKAGAHAEIIHIKQLFSGEKDIFDSQILNLSGGFLHGDILGAGMCAANELEHAVNDRQKKLKDLLLDYAEKGNIIYGQCNGFQLLVKTGLLPGINNDCSRQTVTLTHNDCGNYYVDFVPHKVAKKHFAFDWLDSLYLWCRHGEGKFVFYSDYGLVSKEDGEIIRKKVNEHHVLLRYTKNPNVSVDNIAGLVNSNGRIFGHMAHPEASVYASQDPRFFFEKDELRRHGIKAFQLDDKTLENVALRIFKNIVNYFR
jgi:phosphoribosylformylglycinamidine synthase